MNQLGRDRVKQIVEQFKTKRLLVLGDVMMDKYIWGNVTRISPEAPVPVVHIRKSTSCLGGSGNVGRNLKSLGSSSLVIGVIGRDEDGEWIKTQLKDSRGIFTVQERPTTVKTRVIAHHQQVVRVDVEKRAPVPAVVQEKILNRLKEERFDGLVISDYNKGVVSESLMDQTLAFTSKNGIPVFVDPKVENFSLFSPVTLITPNHLEAEQIVRHKCDKDEDVASAGREILSRISTTYLMIKRGGKGMAVFDKKGHVFAIPAFAKEVFDVTGAGDTVMAAASLALLCGATIHESAVLANAAAGIVVGKIGTATLTPEELVRTFPA